MISYETLESDVMTKIKYGLSKDIRSKFPNMSFGNQPADTSQGFPNVDIHQGTAVEKGQTLEGNVINNALIPFTVTVRTNTSKEEARTVIYAIMYFMKASCWNIVGFPVYSKDSNIHTYILNIRRYVAPDDTI